MLTNKPAPTEREILTVIKHRWSPLAYSDKPVEKEKVFTLLEAAGWAPSSFNEQPWQYVVGFKGDENHQKLADCIVEGNSWAKTTPVLMLSIAKLYFAQNDKPNRHYLHDTGAANGYMALQATELGLIMHQMAGFEIKKARELFDIMEGFEPASMIAIGYMGDSNALPDDLKQRDLSPRSRKPLKEMFWKTDL